MSYLILTNSLKLSGSEKKFAKIASSLAERGHGVHLACLNRPTELASGLHPQVAWHCFNRSGPFDIGAARAVSNYVETHAIEKVLAVNLYPSLYAAHVGKSLGKPYAVAINQLELLSVKDRLQMPLYRQVLRRASRLIFGAKAQAERWTTEQNLNPTPHRVIYNGTLVPPLAKREQSPEITVGLVANYRPWKGIDTLVEGFAAWPYSGKRLIIVGDGAANPELQSLLRKYGVEDKVELVPVTPEVESILQRMDIFCLPARSELFSNSALEAMACGIPVVLSSVGGLPEMISHEKEGLLIPPDSPKAVREALVRLEDPEQRKTMGALARQTCEMRFPFAHMVDQYEALFEETW